jgi:hypothetical protein
MMGANVQQVNPGYFNKWQGIHPDDSTRPTSADQSPAEGDQVTLSRQGLEQSQGAAASPPVKGPGSGQDQLDRQEIAQLQELKTRDQEVRAHELAHLSVAGPYARSGMSFTYQKGPDGVSYAIGGEVSVDLAQESTPEATLQKMGTIRRAALAPADPSPADRQIAAQAEAKEAQARQEILQKNQGESPKGKPSSTEDTASQTTEGGRERPRFPAAKVSIGRAISAYQAVAKAA